jgi:DcmR-like sensory protein
MSAYAATGLQSLREVLWRSHVCQFFSNGSDLRDTLVPFFKAGLQKNERCLLVAMGRSARAPKANRHDVRVDVDHLNQSALVLNPSSPQSPWPSSALTTP